MMNLWYTWIMQRRPRTPSSFGHPHGYYYREENANVHRGVHTLAERATAAYEASREKFASLLVPNQLKRFSLHVERQLVLTGLVVLQSRFLSQEMRWLFPIMEHHSNIIPWQEACKKAGAKLVYAYLKDGQLDMEDLANKISEKTKFVSLALQVSNVLGLHQSC